MFDAYEHLNISHNQDGSLTRYIKLPCSPATGDASEIRGQSVLSKDITLNADKKTWMRIYRPANDKIVARLPIIFYFHFGGWIQGSIAETLIHEQSNHISGEAQAIVVAVDYRLAPEYRLPAQYEDAEEAVIWIRNQVIDSNGETWIKDYGDISRCYLYGGGNGGNIAFNVALRLPELNLHPLKIAGTILNQPLFGGQQRTRSELKYATDQLFPLPVQDLIWELALPPGSNRDHRYCHPFADGTVSDKVKELGKCLVIGFGGSPLYDRQQEFVQILVQHGVMVEAQFDDVGFHGIDLVDSRIAEAIVRFIKELVHSAPASAV